MNAATVAVLGAGAVGSYYGALLARAGHRVTLIGRAAHIAAIQRDGLRLEVDGASETVQLRASTQLDAMRDASLVLFSVKSSDTDAAAQAMAPLLGPDALVLSLQNGVDNARTIARHVRQPVVPAVVYVATQMPAPGCVTHHGGGALVIGALDAAGVPDASAAPMSTRLQGLVDLFAEAGVTVRISADVMAELWSKLMVNCAYNAVSGLAQARYGALAALPAVRELQQAVVREVVAVAAAAGVKLSLDDALQAMARIAEAMPGQRSSTAQDMARQRPSEIDHLNGYVVRRGAALGVATPVNQALHALVKLVEAGHGQA